MKQILVACRTGMGSSMMLKIKVEQVIREQGWDMDVEHDEISAANSFKGDVLITMADLAHEYEGKPYDVIGINNLMDKSEIERKLKEYLERER